MKTEELIASFIKTYGFFPTKEELNTYKMYLHLIGVLHDG
jgi:hypothetical protein